MIVEYNEKYIEEVKDLFVELQEYIASIDKEGYNIVTSEYREKNYIDEMKEIEEKNGKMFLYIENNQVLGLIVGIIDNEERNEYHFKAPKRGRITELIVTKKVRSKGIGNKLITHMENYLKEQGCKAILLVVFAYNDIARSFYDKHKYHERVLDLIKVY
jgi:ribosomal protein S18 acetylase RimI-like enzyme